MLSPAQPATILDDEPLDRHSAGEGHLPLNRHPWSVRRSRVALLVLGVCLASGCSEPEPAAQSAEYEFSADWFSRHIGVWQQKLGHLKGRPDLHYLEVGVYEGRSFFWVLEHLATHPTARLYAVDVFPDDVLGIFRTNLARSGQSRKVVIERGYSGDVLKRLPAARFDLIYIDGSHVAREVLRDAILAWDLLKTGGLMIFDDYQMRPRMPIDLRPELAIDSFLTTYGDSVEVLHKEWQVFVRKREPCPAVHENYASRIGDYCYYWNQYWLPDGRKGLYTMTGQRIELSAQSAKQLERLLASKKLGQTEIDLGDLSIPPGSELEQLLGRPAAVAPHDSGSSPPPPPAIDDDRDQDR